MCRSTGAPAGPGKSQRNSVTFHASTNLRLQIRRRHEVDRRAVEDALELVQEPSVSEQTKPRREVDQKINVAVGDVLAARDAAEHSKIRCPTWLNLVSARLAVDGVEGCAEVVG